MHFLIVALSAILASPFAIAQTPDSLAAQVPSCAFQCLLSAALSAGCGQTDYTCICGTGKDAIRDFAIPCIVKSCSTTDALLTQRLAAQVCDMVGKPLKSKDSGSSIAVKSTTVSPTSASSSGSSSAVTSTVAPSITTSASIPTSEAISTSTSSASSTTSSVGSVTGTSTAITNTTSSEVASNDSSSGPRIKAMGAVVAATLLTAFVF